MWPPLLYSDLPYHIISTPTRPYTGDFGNSHGDFGDFTYPNSSLPNPTTPNPTHPYPDLPYHIISTPTRPYNGYFGNSHGDFGGDFGFSSDPGLYEIEYIILDLLKEMRLCYWQCLFPGCNLLFFCFPKKIICPPKSSSLPGVHFI